MHSLFLLHNRAAGAALALRHTSRQLGLSPSAEAASHVPMDSNTSRQIHTERVLQADGTDSGVRIMHLNKPDTLNSLTVTMAGDFEAALRQLQVDKAARALIITGVGDRAFSAGGDFEFIQQRMESTVQDNAQALEGFYKTFLALRKLPIASIAAINGAAVGGGMGLAAAADIRLAADNARLGYNFVKLGLSPGMASTALLPSITNHQVACRLLLTGDLISAQEAKSLGLVLDVVDPEQLLPAAKELARRIAAASPAAVAATLSMLRQALPWEQLEAAAKEEAQRQAALFLGPDIKEGLEAVKEKRQPSFEVQDG